MMQEVYISKILFTIICVTSMKKLNNFNICQPQLFTSLQTVATDTVINIYQQLCLTKKIHL